MKLNEIIDINCSLESNIRKLRKALSKTKWLKDRYEPEELTLEVLEKLYKKVVKKYPARISYIQNAGDNSMSAMVKRTDNHAWIETIYFVSFYECVAKVLLVLYGYFVKGIKFKDKKEAQY